MKVKPHNPGLTRPSTRAAQLTGASLPEENFKPIIVYKPPSRQQLQEVLHGMAPAIHIRQILPTTDAERLTRSFHQVDRVSRGDDVPGKQIGTGSYMLRGKEYMIRVERTNPELHRFYEDARLNPESLFEDLAESAAYPGQNVRRARCAGKSAAVLRAAEWSGAKDGHVLAPHEDASQLETDWEIKNVLAPMAINLYISTPKVGGELVVYNLRPSKEARTRLGVRRKGYPYPLEPLGALQSFSIQPAPGDIVVLAGSYVHAVRSWAGASSERVLINGFVGATADEATLLQYS